MKNLATGFVLVCVFLFGWSGTGLAVEMVDIQPLLDKINELQARVAHVEDLEERVAELEAQVATQQGQGDRSADQQADAVAMTADESDPDGIGEIVAKLFDKKQPIHVGGALRVNYGFKDWDDRQEDIYGDFAFDLFRLNLDGEIKNWILSAEYRFYPEYDFHTIHHGYVGYNVSENWQVQAGVHQVPFGLQPYASHNFWFSGAYYIGLEDDYDMGVKGLYENGPLQLALAFYKNGELGSASNASRYSIDVNSMATGGYAGAQPAGNEETNQINGRLAYTFDHGDNGSTELGVSGEWGQLYNNMTNDSGDHWAAGVHMNGNYGNWNVQLEYAGYAYNPDNPDFYLDDQMVPVMVDDDIITMGAFGYSWGVPAEAVVGIANVAYTVPIDAGWLDSITFYSDNTFIEPCNGGQPTIWQNVVGALFASGPVYAYLDVISAENMIFSGGNMVDETDPMNDERTTRVNFNIGYYW